MKITIPFTRIQFKIMASCTVLTLGILGLLSGNTGGVALGMISLIMLLSVIISELRIYDKLPKFKFSEDSEDQKYD